MVWLILLIASVVDLEIRHSSPPFSLVWRDGYRRSWNMVDDLIVQGSAMITATVARSFGDVEGVIEGIW